MTSELSPITVFENSVEEYIQYLEVDNPILWSDTNPYLYSYSVSLLGADGAVDTDEGKIGIRYLQLDHKHGLRVNGEIVKLIGACIHHDNGITGTAEFPYAAEYRVERLKKAGFNAIRSAHYPMSRHLLDACDRLGMYVMDEFSDVWTTSKVEFDYGYHMSEWWEYDVTNMVKKDFNHPSVIMYSIGNEIPETSNYIDITWGKKITDCIKKQDDTRFVTNSMNLALCVVDRMQEIIVEEAIKAGVDISGIDVKDGQEINSLMTELGDLMDLVACSDKAGELTEIAASQVDVVGYNYSSGRYEKDGERYPNRILVGSETYPQDLDVNLELMKKLPYVIGDFDWTGYDYLGEAGIGYIDYGKKEKSFDFYAPYPSKLAYCGDINLIGDFRPIAYWRQTILGLRSNPYIAVQNPAYYGVKQQCTRWTMSDAIRSWNWSKYEDKPVIVEVYSDAEEVELFINGESSGKKPVGMDKKNLTIFDTVYKAGIIEAVSYKNGKETGRDSLFTASPIVKIYAECKKHVFPANGSDVIYVDIYIKDSKGILNPEAKIRVNAEIKGCGQLIGFGSADPKSEENYFDHEAVAFEGRLRAAIRGTGHKGDAQLYLTSPGMESVIIQLEAI